MTDPNHNPSKTQYLYVFSSFNCYLAQLDLSSVRQIQQI